MNLSSSFSPHNDVLNASPTTDPEKLSLIEELKRRGRACVTTGQYPHGRDLYGKAIEVLTDLSSESNSAKRDLSILHSNRALCHLQMNKPSDCYDDATSATCFDPTYLKGFWRLGQACMALKKTQEAVDAYTAALELEEGNKALKKELIKAKKQLVKDQEEAEKKAEEEKEKEKDATVVRKPSTVSTASTASPSTSVVSKTSGSTTNANTTEKCAASNADFTKSDHVRGYKVVNGKKTSFFHHEQTEEEKRLIGDIAPKRIDPATSNPTPSSKTQEKDVSVWNKAGTWEEKDVTDWAIQSVTDKVMETQYDLPDGSPDPNASVVVTNITKLISSKKTLGTAHASVAKVRGKKKYIFEFTICVHWEVTLGSGDKCDGKMTFYDVDGTHEIGEGYDVSDYCLDGDSGAQADAKFLMERFVRDGGFRTAVEKKLDEWIQLFRDTY